MLRAVEWILLGVGSAIAVLAGIRWHRPVRPTPWLLVAASLVALAVGDVAYDLHLTGLADVGYLLNYALITISLLQFTRVGTMLADRSRLIDLLAFSCATLLVVWVYGISAADEFGAVSSYDVIGDLLLIGVIGRLVAEDRRNAAAYLLLTGGFGLLAADITYPLWPDRPAEAGYVLFYLAWGAAGLHPSMTRLTEPRSPEPGPWRLRHIALLALSVATPPAVLLAEALTGTVSVENGLVLAVSGAITLLLTVTRLADAVHQHSQALSRERGLRTATTDLVAAADLPAVDAAVRAAVTRLLPPHAVRRVVLATDDGRLAGENLPPAPAGADSRSWLATTADPDERTLICPLRLEPLAVARPSGGALVITGSRDALTAGRDALEVLAGQAALALDRITLVEAVGRRDSDLYLRAVIRNTAEIMAVVDSDRRIRYASPALRQLIGLDELPPLTALDDLIHPDDRRRVQREMRATGDGTIHCALQRVDETQALIEITYRDLREDRLVQGLVVTLKDITDRHDPVERLPHPEQHDDMPGRVNRRSAQHKFRY
ncbi:PAS domain S-box protein [Actinoplanes rectilineatus]|uniref:PAS domain S-box protein n=1 Tax=Actinoplanes rectilineatus TaxID=113571 RepID=UPI0005F2D3F1|nr:PAS domain S-box protein [Actinoplanes rectilineatus]